MTRTFIALEMNTTVQKHLADIIHQVSGLLPSGRWVDSFGIHLTLAFLGELNDSRLQAAIKAVQAAASSLHPFSYSFSRMGIFGTSSHPTVLWMGVNDPSNALRSAHHALNQQLVLHGFPTDSRPFSPHLTLARFKKTLSTTEQQQLQTILSMKLPLVDPAQSYPVASLDVMKSELSRYGAQYTLLRKCPFTT
jgi:2'-5' RNA ligase